MNLEQRIVLFLICFGLTFAAVMLDSWLIYRKAKRNFDIHVKKSANEFETWNRK